MSSSSHHTPSSAADLLESVQAIRAVIQTASRDLVARDWLLELLCLAAIAGEHVLIIGPAGTAKSEAARRVARGLGGTYFEYLLGRFTEPSELFGPVDLRKLREGVVETVTDGMLPEAEVAFLDELFLGSTAILNTLLGILNERVFRRGHTTRACKLRLCVAASNALPGDDALAALADRFLVRAFVHPVADAQLEDLLEAGFGARAAPVASVHGMHALTRLAAAVPNVDMAEARPVLAEALRTLRNAGVVLSDRRVVHAQHLVAAAALMSGRTSATAQDVWPLLYVVPTELEQLSARDLLGDLLARSDNLSFPSAAEQATFSLSARATRLTGEVQGLLVTYGACEDEQERRKLRLRLEALGREIDAGFAPSALTPELREARTRLAEPLS